MSRLGHYEILERVATGGMAEVYLAADVRTRPPAAFALKRIKPAIAADAEVVRMLVDEGRLTSLLTHRGIARTVKVEELAEQVYLVMEYVDGRDLRSVLTLLRQRGVKLAPELAVLVVLRAAEALDYAHRLRAPDGSPLNVVHRDVSPSNLMVSYAGEVRLIDFGIARAERRLTETHTGIVKGKYRYMAPEQALGKRGVDGRADVYSLGVVLYEALAGEKLLPQLSDMELLAAVVHSRIPPLRHVAKDAPPALARIVQRAMDPDLAIRYGSCAELSSDLRAYLSDNVPHALGPHDLASLMARLFPGEALRLPALLARAANVA